MKRFIFIDNLKLCNLMEILRRFAPLNDDLGSCAAPNMDISVAKFFWRVNGLAENYW